jgi:hypothetical protein
MLYLGHQCGGLCGTGHLYFKKKKWPLGSTEQADALDFLEHTPALFDLLRV